MAPLKYSKQRESIKHFLSGRTDHPTAETIYTSLREEQPHISLGTVYRNLSLLTEIGSIQKIATGDGPDHFDGNTASHPHFICRCCHQVSDLDADGMDQITASVSSDFNGSVEGYILNFYGVCPQCTETPEREKENSL